MIVAIVAIAGSIAYYFVFFKPNMQREELKYQKSIYEQEQAEKIEEQVKLEEIKTDGEERAEIEKYINDYNSSLSKFLAKAEGVEDLDKSMDIVFELMTEVKNLYVPKTCEKLHKLNLQSWQTYYVSLSASKNNDYTKVLELTAKLFELRNLADKEMRELLQ